MKSHTQYLTLNLPARLAFQNITAQVQDAVRASGVIEGLVLVNAMHITASVFINDAKYVEIGKQRGGLSAETRPRAKPWRSTTRARTTQTRTCFNSATAKSAVEMGGRPATSVSV